jgi:hypothetical protein
MDFQDRVCNVALIECHASGGHRNLATTSALGESTLHGAPLVWRRAPSLNKTTSGPAASIGSATAGFHPSAATTVSVGQC